MERKRNNIEAGIERQQKARIFFIRHSRATYASYTEKLKSESPESTLDLSTQLPDLPEAGIELAKESAQTFFSKFDNSDVILYFVSSTQARALETAKIYSEVALDNGFEIVSHQKEAPAYVSKFGGEHVRSLDSLSLHMENQVLASIFNPATNSPDINWEQVEPEVKDKFEKAKEIVLADDRGSWGANFYVHADAVKAFIPEMETPNQLNETQYTNLQRLASFAREKATGDKQVVVIAFGHENYMGKALEEDTGREGISNTEPVEFTESGGLERFDA